MLNKSGFVPGSESGAGYSGESRNPVLSGAWTPAFAGVTGLFSGSLFGLAELLFHARRGIDFSDGGDRRHEILNPLSRSLRQHRVL